MPSRSLSAATAAPRHRDTVRVSPYEVAMAGDTAATAAPRTKQQLLSLSRRAERRQLAGREGDLVLVALQHARFYTARTRAIYAQVAAAGATVVVFGAGLPTDLSGPAASRVATVGIAEDDLLADEWLVIFCSARSRWGFLSRDLAAGLPGARSAPRTPAAENSGFDPEKLMLWADLKDPVWLERAAAVLLTRVPELAASVPWLSR